ncbi:hypothetical protein HPY86_08015 [candidate division WOR-3 bacterium]|nr:hypothetical protein [candidate division WOR-3 bacterium]
MTNKNGTNQITVLLNPVLKYHPELGIRFTTVKTPISHTIPETTPGLGREISFQFTNTRIFKLLC